MIFVPICFKFSIKLWRLFFVAQWWPGDHPFRILRHIDLHTVPKILAGWDLEIIIREINRPIPKEEK